MDTRSLCTFTMKSLPRIPLLLTVALILSGCASTHTQKQPVGYEQLRGWNEQSLNSVKSALMNSCKKLNQTAFSDTSIWGSYTQWQSLCKELEQTPERQLKAFFEHNFTPVPIAPESPGLFTGYYSPVISGSRKPDATHQVALRKVPKDLVQARLGEFELTRDLSGKTLVGQVNRGYLKPYKDRKTIEQTPASEEEALLWLTNAEDKFFLQIQGSGNVQLEDGEIVHVGYAGNNGHHYVPIGRILKESGELKDVSMQTIKQWLAEHPDKQQWLFNQNPRYIFFQQNKEGAITAQGVPAVSGRTLAVDPKVVPLGLPVWLDTRLTATDEPFQRLMVTQDTGSAIKGPARGDIYLGIGKEAAMLAGKQKAPGKMYVLVPRAGK